MMKYRVALRSDVGRQRKSNQDNGGSFPEQGLFLVADGMGGHQGGETASRMVLELVPTSVKEAQSKAQWDPQIVIRDAILDANYQIHHRSEEEDTLRGMGTTTTAILFTQNAMTIGHVGDSRCYFSLGNALWQLTRDHSLVEEKRRAGLISREEAKIDLMKNVITRSVGFEPNVVVDVYEKEVQKGDIFLICSDGLSGMIEDPEIHHIIEEHLVKGDNIDQTADQLISAANQAGGEDNITALLIQVLEA